MKKIHIFSLCCLLIASAGFSVELRVASVFSDNMVLQRDRPVRVWGQAHPGEQVTVGFKGLTATVRADWYGCWQADLPPLAADHEPAELAIKAGTESITFANVLVGEVWLASGQSNMVFPVEKVLNAKEEIASADDPLLRLFSVSRVSSLVPLEDFSPEGRPVWQICAPQNVTNFSAAAYFFPGNCAVNSMCRSVS